MFIVVYSGAFVSFVNADRALILFSIIPFGSFVVDLSFLKLLNILGFVVDSVVVFGATFFLVLLFG